MLACPSFAPLPARDTSFMDDTELAYLIAVSAAAVWTPRPLVSMLAALGSARALVKYAKSSSNAPPPECELLGSDALDRIAALDADSAGAALAEATKSGQHFVTSADAQYPKKLRDLCDPPPVLYYRGHLAALDGRVVAIVGSRAPTAYGRAMAGTIAADFAAYGATVISGLARGIDAAAHRGSLRAESATVAVLGSGLRALYPPYHGQLADDIVSGGGALISEFPPTMPAQPYQFPMRNRLVAGLARATFVIEAGAKSGALITARLANDLGRHVFALPGDVGRSSSEGTNGLIKDGVALATGASDVAAVLGWEIAIAAGNSQGTGSELLGALELGGSSIDEVCAKTGLDPATVAAELTILEMQGLIERRPGGLYAAVSAGPAAKTKA